MSSLSLSARRALVAVLSIVLGLVGTQIILLILGTDWVEFGIEAVLVIISLATVVLIWADYIFSAEILPD